MKITIDKQQVEATPGETILQTAKKAGIRIPNLCQHQACGGKGLCRICIVEVKAGNETGLVESCTYPVMDNISVRTSSPLIDDIRRSMISLLIGKGDIAPVDVAETVGAAPTDLWLQDLDNLMPYQNSRSSRKGPGILWEGLLTNPYMAYIIVDENGYIKTINKTCLERMEIKLEDAVGRYISDVVPNSELPKILETGRTDRAEFWPINGHDTIVSRVPLTKDGKVVGAVAYSLFLDMSGARIFMNKLQEREKEFNDFLQGLLENPYLAYIIVDQDAVITAINQATLEILEMEKADAMGKHILDIVPNSELPQIIKTGRTDRAEFWPINGRDTVVCRLPITKEGNIIGAIGYSLFLDKSGAKILSQKIMEMEKQLNQYKDELCEIYSARWTLADLIGNSPAFAGVRSIVERLSFTTSTVLITGESGTGKELVAQAIHNNSICSSGPFIRINCVALPENLMESELFGYEEGAFTGAKKGGKPGKFELAAGGTIFLDEIGDMPLTMQTKLLAVLQEKVIERVGGTKPIPVDVRVIAATNQDLEKLVVENKFRGDLYYRLNVVRIDMPPLRGRLEDLPLLVDTLISRINHKLGTNIERISAPAMELLQNYPWPGNVRELENLLEQAINLAFMNQERTLGNLHFPTLIGSSLVEITQMEHQQIGLTELVQNLEKEMILQALNKSGGNKFQAARILSLNISALYRKMRKYGLE